MRASRVRHRSVPGAAIGVLAAGAAAVSPASAAEVIHGGRLASSAGGDAIVLRVDPAKLRLRSAVVAFRAACENGRSYSFHAPLRVIVPTAESIPAGTSPPGDAILLQSLKRGTLKGTVLRAEDLGGGRTGAIALDLAGTLGTARSSGTLSAKIEVMPASGTTPETTCRTGTVRWTASHTPGRVFAGATSQGEPIVVWATRDHRNITKVAVGWHSTCTPQGSFDYPDVLVRFPVTRSGSFGDAFRWTPDGTTDRFDYVFRGRLTPSRASGKLQVTYLPGAAAGTKCPTGPLTWRADSR